MPHIHTHVLLAGMLAILSCLQALGAVLPCRQGVRTSEQLTVGLLVMVLVCFLVDLLLSKPPIRAVLGGMKPVLQRDSVYAAVCLLGANVMPHNFYLHSALVAGQARGKASHSLRQLCLYNFLDIAAALGLALLVNVAVLLVAAATFHQAGTVVETLQDAHDLMEKILSSSVAPAAFGLALLCAGQLSTFTGTIAGQVVLRGFLNVRISTWLRRVSTRTAAVLPAALLQYAWGDKATYKFLLVAQVVLALQLPFTLVPLIKATSSKKLMGSHKNSVPLAVAAWAASGLVFLANLMLFVAELWPGAAFVPEVIPGAPDSPLHQYLDNIAGLAWARPVQFLLVAGLLVSAAALLALQLWVIITPLSHNMEVTPLLLRQTSSRDKQMWQAYAPDLEHDVAAAEEFSAGAYTAEAASSHTQDAQLQSKSPEAAFGMSTSIEHSSSRRIAVGWNVPGVREWLLGIQPEVPQAYGAGGRQLAAYGLSTADQNHEHRLLLPQPQDSEQLSTMPTDSGQTFQKDVDSFQKQPAGIEQAEIHPTAADKGYDGTVLNAEEQEQQQVLIPDSWEEEADCVGSFTLPAPSSPTAGSEVSVSLSHLGADREMWLDSWPDSCPASRQTITAAEPLHHSSSIGTSISAAISIYAAASESSMSCPALTAGQQNKDNDRGSSSGSHLSKSGRRAYAAALDSFWSIYYDTHGNWIMPVPPRSSGQQQQQQKLQSSQQHKAQMVQLPQQQHIRQLLPVEQQSQHLHLQQAWHQQLGQQRKRSYSQAVGPQSPRHQERLDPGSNRGSYGCKCGGGGSSNNILVWCPTCAGAVLSHMQQSLAEVLLIPGAAALVTPDCILQPMASHEQQPATPSASNSSTTGTSCTIAAGRASSDRPHKAPDTTISTGGQSDATVAARLLLQDAVSQLPDPLVQLLRAVLPATAASTLQDALPHVVQLVEQMQQHKQQQPVRGGDHQATAAAAADAQHHMIPATALLVLDVWGMWCILQLLVLAQVEVRPELWGKYATVLNRLQGCLGHITQDQAQQHQQQEQHHRHAAYPAPFVMHAVSSTGFSRGSILANADKVQVQQVLLALLHQLELAVADKKAPSNGSNGAGGVGSAYAKGKEICISVVKRYRRQLQESCDSSSSIGRNVQQHWHGHQHWAQRSSSGSRGSQRYAALGPLGILLGSLVMAPLMYFTAANMAPAGSYVCGIDAVKNH
eukprot:GHRR01014066.1.p1 GENE.GHRR01014066.1~~GHRR01014066.1.p1  ORF type:complete len:1200 (+),score=508.94 GHRR01014066.1:1255-4854(+)